MGIQLASLFIGASNAREDQHLNQLMEILHQVSTRPLPLHIMEEEAPPPALMPRLIQLLILMVPHKDQ